MTDEQHSLHLEHSIPEVEPEPFKMSEELQLAIANATLTLQRAPFSKRHPELGKMVNCPVCSTRHRQHERKCEQVFTYRVGDYELFREDEDGNLVPDYRTALRPDEAPTRNQVIGRAAFAKKRFHPHPSKIKLLLIERTRAAFERIGFYLLDVKSEKYKNLTPEVQKLVLADFQEDLHRARIIAAREIRREREISDREYRRRADQARRINHGFRVNVRA